MTDRDVVKEALEKADSDGWGDTVASIDTYPQKEIATFLKHILDAGPDKKMASADGFNVKKPEPNHIPRWFPSQIALFEHLIERLQEQSE